MLLLPVLVNQHQRPPRQRLQLFQQQLDQLGRQHRRLLLRLPLLPRTVTPKQMVPQPFYFLVFEAQFVLIAQMMSV